MSDIATGHAKAFKGLWAGHLVDEVAVDIEQAGAVLLTVDDVVVEYLVVECTRCAHGFGPWLEREGNA
jgi:hypothetical protein